MTDTPATNPAGLPPEKASDGTAVPSIAAPYVQETRTFLEADQESSVNPIALLFRLMRGRWTGTLVVGALVGVLLALLAGLMASPVYESEGLVRIIAREPKILFADRDDSRLRLFDAFVDGEATYLQSRAVLERAFLAYEAKRMEKGEDAVDFKAYQERLSVKKLKGLIQVSAKSGQADVAQDSVNALLDGYAQMHEEQAGRRQDLRVMELETRIKELLARRSILEGQLLTIGEEYDASSLSKAHLAKVVELEEIDGRLAEITNSIVRMEAANGALDADTGDMEIKRATLLDRAMADMVFERAKRAAELEQMSLRYQSNHPKVARLQAGLQVIDDAIENRRRLIATLGKTGAITGGDGAVASQSIKELKALQEKLQGRRTALSNEAKRLNGKLIQLAAVNAERREIGTMLSETRAVLDQVVLESRNSLPGTAEILSRASQPLQPVSNKRKALMLAGLIMGGGLVGLVVLARAFFQSSMRYSDDALSLAPAMPAVVTGAGADDLGTAYERVIANMQFTPVWQRERATVLAVTRLNSGGHANLVALGFAASRLKLKTLLITPGENSLHVRGDLHIQPFPIEEGGTLSASRLAPKLSAVTTHYDLVLIDAGQGRESAATITLNKIADAQIALLRPGSLKRSLKRFLAQSSRPHLIFTHAMPDDPERETAHADPIARVA